MENRNRKELTTILAIYIRELICLSTSDSDIEEFITLKNKDKRIERRKVSRVRNYVEVIAGIDKSRLQGSISGITYVDNIFF